MNEVKLYLKNGNCVTVMVPMANDRFEILAFEGRFFFYDQITDQYKEGIYFICAEKVTVTNETLESQKTHQKSKPIDERSRTLKLDLRGCERSIEIILGDRQNSDLPTSQNAGSIFLQYQKPHLPEHRIEKQRACDCENASGLSDDPRDMM